MKFAFRLKIAVYILLLFNYCFNISAQPLVADEATKVLLKFDDESLSGFGINPVSKLGLIYQSGVHGSGVYFGDGSLLEIDNTPDLPTSAGTIEFWVKPTWTGGDNLSRDFIWWGDYPGSFYLRYYEGWILATFNASTAQNFTIWAGHNNEFKPFEWNQVAITWESNNFVRIFLNGKLLREEVLPFPFVRPQHGNVRIGGSQWTGAINAVIDEFRISEIARDIKQIEQSYFSGFNDIDIQLPTTNFYPEWHLMPRVTARIGSEFFDISPTALNWTSSSPSTAEARADGRIHAKAAGSAELTAQLGSQVDSITVNVKNPKLQPVFETIDPFLAQPASDAQVVMPVVILRFLPTQDGVMLDDRSAPDFWSLNPVSLDYMRNRTLEYDRRVKFAVEEATRFRGYKRPHAKPYLGYKVVAYITIYEVTPPRFADRKTNGYDVYYNDFHSIFERFGLDHYINNLGVREIWLWENSVDPDYPSFDPNYNIVEHSRVGWESNMSSPLMADISNSNRDTNDLPILNHTYILYGQNMRRSQAEALHNRGHQFEAMFSYAAWLQDQDPQYNFFWNTFVGRIGSDQFITGRAGWTHMPPNTTSGYDYTNTFSVVSDIEDWRPDNSGQKKSVNADTWASINYDWPGATDFLQKDETQWYLYWFQNFPGQWNKIFYGEEAQVSNWWEFVADWDKAIQSNLRLYRPRNTPNYSDWLLEHGLSLSNSISPDADGVPLFLKYATGTTVGRPISTNLTQSGNACFLEFDRLASAADVKVGAMTSNSLHSNSWSIQTIEEVIDQNTDLHRVKIQIPSDHGRGFARLFATANDSAILPQVYGMPSNKQVKMMTGETRTILPPMPEYLTPNCPSCLHPWHRVGQDDQ